MSILDKDSNINMFDVDINWFSLFKEIRDVIVQKDMQQYYRELATDIMDYVENGKPHEVDTEPYSLIRPIEVEYGNIVIECRLTLMDVYCLDDIFGDNTEYEYTLENNCVVKHIKNINTYDVESIMNLLEKHNACMCLDVYTSIPEDYRDIFTNDDGDAYENIKGTPAFIGVDQCKILFADDFYNNSKENIPFTFHDVYASIRQLNSFINDDMEEYYKTVSGLYEENDLV